MADKSPYEVFAGKMMQPDSKYIPKILQYLTTDQQAEMLMALPKTAAQLAEQFGLSTEDAEAAIDDLYRKGLAFGKEKDGEMLWRAPMHLAQFHDATIVWPEATEEFLELWRIYMEEEWPQLAPGLAKILPRPFTRVIPVEASLDGGKAKVLAPENVRQIIADADKIAVTKCTCRLTMKKCDAPIDVCLQINKGAQYTIDRGSGREVSKEEAMKIIEDTEKAGLIHVTMNKADVGHFICNCCGCCCQSFTMLISDNVNLCDPSRYAPQVDADTCTGCGTCADRCYFSAIAVNDDNLAQVNVEQCLGCGQCAFICPEEAITMVEERSTDFIPQ
jgi:Pyruvate/2-oxoacid:ferredoxin oxidoreductase delta subunit